MANKGEQPPPYGAPPQAPKPAYDGGNNFRQDQQQGYYPPGPQQGYYQQQPPQQQQGYYQPGPPMGYYNQQPSQGPYPAGQGPYPPPAPEAGDAGGVAGRSSLLLLLGHSLLSRGRWNTFCFMPKMASNNLP
ncbi:hypothetical protein RJ55_08233 [Drechmeria coniospora]|nr:hypothetical protein RJ55_08233 [Drechmeria coniospora]